MSGDFDAIVIGAGQAGIPLAGRLSAAGRRVALIERAALGGTCVNTGCTPTKAMVASAHAAHLARRGADFGVAIDGPVGIDFAAVQARQRRISGDSRAGVESWVAGMANCTLIRGHARFRSAHEVEVDGDVLAAPQIFLNVGTRAAVPELPGIGDVTVLTNVELLALNVLPEHLIVVGGSYIGLEFGQIFRRLGSAVTIVEKAPRLVAREDEDVSAAIEGVLAAEGVAIRTGAECIRFARGGGGIRVGVDCTQGEPEVVGSHVLLAVGRRPNTEDLGLDRAGVAVDARGYVTVDDGLRTSVDGIFALGDCNGRGAFTHTSYNDFEIVAANLLDGGDRRVTDRLPAYALYTDPPLGRVGMTEREAREQGRPVRVGQRPMTRVGRAVEKGETQGLMKVVVDAATEEILGAAILGPGGDEAVHGVLDMMSVGGSAEAMRRAVPIHPTVSELIPTIFGELGPPG
ncbi:FAD-containing oxidoreductase [Aurantimonas sp. MSK8Z-1]|uniref:FAD-containing oxidoreductase n=1 Tax=Mangrovibrevibacter kandeliae TaxID=2968473 RepID=UPI002118203C|nr:FAD-containing oxidoreductase [Aurantimonas sp. MSK8Z-1]MCW4116858.1 FAD-containing oxidoreductase [Aurantimonas sp. MSK8Z-1]